MAVRGVSPGGRRGNIRWVRHVVHLTQDPLSGNVLAHIYLIRSDPLSQLEQALGRDLARDAVTRLFAPEMAEKIAVSVFPARGRGAAGSFCSRSPG